MVNDELQSPLNLLLPAAIWCTVLPCELELLAIEHARMIFHKPNVSATCKV